MKVLIEIMKQNGARKENRLVKYERYRETIRLGYGLWSPIKLIGVLLGQSLPFSFLFIFYQTN